MMLEMFTKLKLIKLIVLVARAIDYIGIRKQSNIWFAHKFEKLKITRTIFDFFFANLEIDVTNVEKYRAYKYNSTIPLMVMRLLKFNILPKIKMQPTKMTIFSLAH